MMKSFVALTANPLVLVFYLFTRVYIGRSRMWSVTFVKKKKASETSTTAAVIM